MTVEFACGIGTLTSSYRNLPKPSLNSIGHLQLVVSHRGSHENLPTIGGVHKIQILIRDLLKEFLQQIFGEEMGGSGGPRPPY